MAASRTAAVDPFLAVAHRTAGSGPSTVLDGITAVGAEDAALANGMLVRALDFDDVHVSSRIHVTSAVLPAAIAVAEQVGASGMDLVGAYLAGAEITTRLGSAASAAFRARGWDPTPIAGVFGSALAAAWLRELDGPAAQHALGIAGSLAAGSVEYRRTADTTRLLQPGFAGRNALLAVDLAATGATGPAGVWEGPDGLFATYVEIEVDPDVLVADLGDRWETTQISTKRHPCSHLVHSAVDAALSLRRDGVTAASVVDLVAFVHPDLIGVVCDLGTAAEGAIDPHAEPASAAEARQSLPWCVASAIVDGAVTEDSFRPDRLGRPVVTDLARRVRCESVDHVHGSAGLQPGRLRVTLPSTPGRSPTEMVAMAPAGLGGADRPVSDVEVVAKFLANCGHPSGGDRLANRLLTLEDEPSIADVIDDVVRTTAPGGPVAG